MKCTLQSIVRFFLLTNFLILHSCQPFVTRALLLSPYSDTQYKKGRQSIPGKLQCEYFDFGGEGIAFHDSDSSNRGSGALNKGTDDLSTFRKNESVDISFTKFHNGADNSSFNLVQPEEKQLYVGWTEPGEWTKLSSPQTKSTHAPPASQPCFTPELLILLFSYSSERYLT